jgi:hypothetical protein
MSNNKQNQAQPPAVAAQQFQPFYYYTANGQVQIGYPQMLAGMYKNGAGAFPYAMPFYYNNNFLQQQAAQQQNAAMNAAMNFHNTQSMPSAMQAPNTNHTNPMNVPSNNKNNTKSGQNTGTNKQETGKKDSVKGKKLIKKMVQAQSSLTNSESSDHGVHFNSHSKNESSDNGSNAECNSESEKEARNNQKSELITKIAAVKPKKSKPAKPCKKVICVDLPEDLQSIETVTNRFQQYGEILLVRVLKPGKVMPFDLKVYSGKIRDLGQTVCAIIEFETPSAATDAVQKEVGNLRLAALQQGAHIALYGSVDSDTNKAHSEHSAPSSDHTHGESGIHNQSSFTSRSGSSHAGTHSNHDDMSHDSHDDFDEQIEQNQRKASLPNGNNKFLPNFKPNFKPRSSFCRGQKDLKIEVSSKNQNSEHQKLVAEVSGVSTCETIKNVEIEKTPLSEQITTIPNNLRCSKDSACDRASSSCTDSSNETTSCAKELNKKAESKIVSTNNGRITTALNITLTSSNNSNSNNIRTATKLELTSYRHHKVINMRACDLLPPPTRPVGRASPGLLSDPSDEFLMENFLAKAQSVKKYSRDYLMSLKETMRASVFPKGMRNIPDIVPTYSSE